MAPQTGIVGGPRHYTGPTLGAVGVWKCPSCGAENSGAIDDGCTACGSGSAKARHVGVPPSRTAATKPTHLLEEALIPDVAFGQFMVPYRGEFSPRVEQVLFEAWNAAIRWYQSTLRQQVTETPAEPEIDRVSVPKALLDQVIVTLEQTTDLPDGQQSQELIDLIAQLKEIVG